MSLRRRPTGRQSSTLAWSTQTACCCGPRSCSAPPKLLSCAHGGKVPSLCAPARTPTPTPSCCSVACATALPSTSHAGAPPARGPVSDSGPGQEGEHEAELLLDRRRMRGVPRCLKTRQRLPATPRCARSSRFNAATRWRSTMPRSPIAVRVAETLATAHPPSMCAVAARRRTAAAAAPPPPATSAVTVCRRDTATPSPLPQPPRNGPSGGRTDW